MTTVFAPHKWVGGKRQLFPEIRRRLPETWTGRYVELFYGSGVVYHNLCMEDPRLVRGGSIVCEANPHIRALLRVLADPENVLCTFLRNEMEWYNSLPPAGREARYDATRRALGHRLAGDNLNALYFLALLYTNHGGLWRTNRKGEYNVPIGRVKGVPRDMRIPLDNIRQAALNIQTGCPRVYADAFTALDDDSLWRAGDVVYADPPYIPASPTASFTAYSADGFGLAQQRRLAERLLALARRSVHVVASNSDTPLTRDLYPESDGWILDRVTRAGYVNSDTTKRGRVGEILIWRGDK